MISFLLWLRFCIGIFIGVFAIALAADKAPAGGATCMAMTVALLFPPKFKVRGQANVLASNITAKNLFTGPLILAGIRWIFGLFYSLGAAAGLSQNETIESIAVLLVGLIFLSPLDRLFFPTLRFPLHMKTRQQSTAIIVVRNLGVLCHIYAAGNYFQKEWNTAHILLGFAIGFLVIAAIVTPRRLIVPRPVSPNFSVWGKVTLPPGPANQPAFKHFEVEAGVSPKLQITEKDLSTLSLIEKKDAEEPESIVEDKVEEEVSNDTLLLPEEKFYRWISYFENKWLETNKYHHRLSIHRNANAFKNQIIKELNDYIQQIREREELKIETRAFATGNLKTEYVTDLITNTWMGDKQLRSLYNAIVKYSTQPNGKPVWAIAEHIAEYRAMINLAKKVKQSQLADAKKQLAQSNHAAPSLSREQLASLSDETYFKIVDYIILLGKNLENYKELNESFNEEHYRDYFLTPLNTMSPHYAAKGEVFNRKGKTDILIFDTKGNNIFIAECKCWNGTAYLIGGVDQLLNTYVNWRDEKAAIIVFNRTVKKFSELMKTATEALSAHSLCVKKGERRTETSWSFWFRHPDDEQRSIRLELILFNFA
jgi:hypothetical protein